MRRQRPIISGPCAWVWKCPPWTPTGRTFTLHLPNGTRRLDFDFELVDTDHVVGRRHIVIQPIDDLGPEVEVQLAVVRKTGEGYKVTPSAMVPFEGWIRDDHGLDRLQYALSYNAIEAGTVSRERARLAARIMHLTPACGAGAAISVAPYLGFLAKVVGADEAETVPTPVALATFAQEQQRLARSDVAREVFLRRLQSQTGPAAVHQAAYLTPGGRVL